jgi:hypothetical protein
MTLLEAADVMREMCRDEFFSYHIYRMLMR